MSSSGGSDEDSGIGSSLEVTRLGASNLDVGPGVERNFVGNGCPRDGASPFADGSSVGRESSGIVSHRSGRGRLSERGMVNVAEVTANLAGLQRSSPQPTAPAR